MGLARRIIVILLSVGWLAPLCLSFAATYNFLHDIMWPAAAFDQPSPWPWHMFEWADELFYAAMGWVGMVVLCWSIHLTGPTRNAELNDD